MRDFVKLEAKKTCTETRGSGRRGTNRALETKKYMTDRLTSVCAADTPRAAEKYRVLRAQHALSRSRGVL